MAAGPSRRCRSAASGSTRAWPTDEILFTTNEKGEQSISGGTQQETWAELTFVPLVKKHRARTKEADVARFPNSKPMAGYFDIRKEEAEALVERGRAKYVDEDETIWRYTLKGSLTYYFVGTWGRPFRRGLRSMGLMRER